MPWRPGALILAGLVIIIGVVRAQEAGSPAPRPFSHRAHYAAAGSEACADCHGALQVVTDGAMAVQAFESCARCHAPGRREGDLALKTDPGAGEVVFPRFDHRTHKGHPCSKCHQLEEGQQNYRYSESLAACQECHGLHYAKSPLTGGQCGPCHISNYSQARIGDNDVFIHSEHLKRAGSGEGCAACHPAAATATELGPGFERLDVRACAECHRGKEGPQTRLYHAAGEPLAFLNFSHAAHGPQAKLGCADCHVYDGKRFDRYIPEGMPRYAGCLGCHAHQEQGVGLHGRQAQACRACHEVEGAAAPAEWTPPPETPPRPATDWSGPPARLAKHSRIKDAGFGRYHHPFEGRIAGRACSECHVIEPSDQPSHLARAPFYHRSHMGAARDDAAECRRCHGAGAAAPDDRLDGGWAAMQPRCQACHQGGRPEFGFEVTLVWKLGFRHEDHAKVTACAACHVREPGPDGLGYAPGVRDCKACHSAHQDVRTEPLAGCLVCHSGRDVFGVAEQRAGVPVALAPTPHDYGENCRLCHAPPGPARRPRIVEMTYRGQPVRRGGR